MRFWQKILFFAMAIAIAILLLVVFNMPSSSYWDCANVKMQPICENWLASCVYR